MTDVHSPEVRSRNMRAIKSANTKPELFVRKALHASGLRYRLGGSGLPGRPDIVLPRYRTVIFVNGCFWHGHDCKYFKVPQSRRDFWLEKIEANQRRDHAALIRLGELGWNVIVIWECVIRRAEANLLEFVGKLHAQLEWNFSDSQTHEPTTID